LTNTIALGSHLRKAIMFVIHPLMVSKNVFSCYYSVTEQMYMV